MTKNLFVHIFEQIVFEINVYTPREIADGEYNPRQDCSGDDECFPTIQHCFNTQYSEIMQGDSIADSDLRKPVKVKSLKKKPKIRPKPPQDGMQLSAAVLPVQNETNTFYDGLNAVSEPDDWVIPSSQQWTVCCCALIQTRTCGFTTRSYVADHGS